METLLDLDFILLRGADILAADLREEGRVADGIVDDEDVQGGEARAETNDAREDGGGDFGEDGGAAAAGGAEDTGGGGGGGRGQRNAEEGRRSGVRGGFRGYGAADGGVDLGIVDVGSGAREVFGYRAEELAWEGHGGECHCGSVCGEVCRTMLRDRLSFLELIGKAC